MTLEEHIRRLRALRDEAAACAAKLEESPDVALVTHLSRISGPVSGVTVLLQTARSGLCKEIAA